MKKLIINQEESNIHLEKTHTAIRNLSEEIVALYNIIEDYFFQDIDFQKVQRVLPIWFSDAGRSAESTCDKVLYEIFRKVYNDPISNRILHWFDVQGLLSAMQDRVIATSLYMEDLYKIIPAYSSHEESEYTSCTRAMNSYSDKAHTNINNVFVSLSSSLDLFTKIIYECSKYDIHLFNTYKRLKSRQNKILYNKINYGFPELKEEGLLYSEPKCIRTICSFRDEFIHNGAWDYRCAIYEPFVNDNPSEPFILSPDIDEETGLLVSSGSRNKFYSKGNRINIILPYIISDVIHVLSITLDMFKTVLENKTVENKDKKDTISYLKLLMGNISLFAESGTSYEG